MIGLIRADAIKDLIPLCDGDVTTFRRVAWSVRSHVFHSLSSFYSSQGLREALWESQETSINFHRARFRLKKRGKFPVCKFPEVKPKTFQSLLSLSCLRKAQRKGIM